MGVRPVLALPSLNGLFAHPRSLTELALALACARPSVHRAKCWKETEIGGRVGESVCVLEAFLDVPISMSDKLQ